MKRTSYIVFVFLISVACSDSNEAKTDKNETDNHIEFRSDEGDNKLQIYIDGQLFTNFFYPEDMEKPALFPIYTISGKPITRGYPYDPRPFERTDHPHHVGLWFNFGDINGLDFWNNSFAIDQDEKHEYGSIKFNEFIKKNPDEGELVVSSDWVDSEDNTLVREKTTFIFSENNSIRFIERISNLTAVQDVHLKGNKEGLLGLRVDRAFEEPISGPEKLLDSQGKVTEGEIENTDGVRNGEYRNANGQMGGDVWGERSPWVALKAKKEDEIITIAIFDHQDNPYYPAWSHARGYGLFAVNNLGGRGMHDDAEEVEINLSPNESLTVTHLIIIGNDVSDDKLNQIFENFNS